MVAQPARAIIRAESPHVDDRAGDLLDLPAAPVITKTPTQCPYCGVGCGLIAETEDGRLRAVSGDPEHPVNRGATCRKPLGLPDAVHAPDRALVPMWRESIDARFETLTWRQMMARLARRVRRIVDEHGPDALAFYISGQLTTEDYYVACKLVKGFLGTNNLDSNSRLCMSSAVSGYTGAFGSDGPPAAYSDIDRTDCMLVVGSNTAACHPIVWARIRDRQRAGARVIVVDPRRTPTAEAADIHLPVRPGTDLPLLAAMLGVLEQDGLIDWRFVERHTEGIEEALATARQWSPARAAEVCQVPEADIVAAARAFGLGPRAMALWSMGVNQSTVGTLKNRALINLCLATGNVGRPGSGPLSLTGQPNAMGGRESGGMSTLLPGYRSTANAEHRAEMRQLWQIPGNAPGISPVPGRPATELVEALEGGAIKLVWIVATNPVVSQPDARRFRAALRRAELLVCQDAYHPTETSALAHVVLPAAGWPEKDGTQTNSERRVGRLRQAIAPPGEALPDWEIFARLGRALGHKESFGWPTAAAVYDEFAACTDGRLCDVSGLSHARLASGTLQWPVPSRGSEAAERGGTERLYTSLRFPTPTGRARFDPAAHREPADRPSPDFPLVLTTGRVANQWHTMTRTAKSADLLASEPEPFVELHADDALTAGVVDGELVRVRSRRGQAVLRARFSDVVPRGTAFAPFHWGALHLRAGHGALNAVVSSAIDPVSKQAELKASAVRVEPVPRFVASAPDGGRAGVHFPGIGSVVQARGQAGSRQRLLIVGTGMAGMATVESVLEHDGPEDWQVTMVGREPDPPYNRVLLSKLVAGSTTEAELSLHGAQWLAAREIELRVSTEVRALDLSARSVELTDGDRLSYDRLVLATGSTAVVPEIAGMRRPGVHVFRTLQDARQIIDSSTRARRAVVVGGGLLGVEAARGLRARGVHVTLVHAARRLMDRQLDVPAALMLERGLRARGVEIVLGMQTEAIVGNDRVTSVVLADGREEPADMVVVAAGVLPDVGAARDAGLEVEQAIVVDDEMRTSHPGVYAVGECAQHRDVVYGLWAPLLEQARVAGASLASAPAAFRGVIPATTLKVAGIDLFCGGRSIALEGDEEVVALDTRRGQYRRLLLRDDRLVGAILLGDLRDAGALREHLATGVRLPETMLSPMGGGEQVSHRKDPGSIVCSCMSVTHGDLLSAIDDLDLQTVDEVAAHTRAGSGCGTCRLDVSGLLAAHRDAPDRAAEPAKAAGAR
jgi:ferredoxin-nitrate reductase